MPRRGENIYKRKDGRWEGRAIRGRTPNGKALYAYLYGHSYKEVKRKMASVCYQEVQSPHRQNQAILFSEAAERWLSAKRLKVKDSTYARYQSLLENHILPHIGLYEVNLIKDEFIGDYVAGLLKHGRMDKRGGLSPKTVTDILAILKAILKYAGNHGQTVSVCFDDFSVRKSHREMRVLSVSEQDKLASLFTHDMDNKRLGVMISLYTGLRLGEVCALKWENIDLTNQVISVRSTMQRIRNNTGIGGKTVVVITEPKSESSRRDIPIPDFLVPIMQKFRRDRHSYVLSGFSDRFVEPRSMENYFKRCVAECGIAPANYHCLRHSFATRCIEVGFDVKSLSEILGHSSVSITLNRYVHSSYELKKQNMNRLKSLFCA